MLAPLCREKAEVWSGMDEAEFKKVFVLYYTGVWFSSEKQKQDAWLGYKANPANFSHLDKLYLKMKQDET